MANSTNDAARAQALLSQAGGTTACVGPRAPTQRRGLRLKALWTGLALSGLVAGAMHFLGGQPMPAHLDATAAPATHAAVQMAHGAAPALVLPATQASTPAPVVPQTASAAPASHTVPPTPASPASGVRTTGPVPSVTTNSSTTPATPPVAPGLIKLPIAVTSDDTTLTLSRKLSDAGEFFPALATSLEELRTSPYYDGCGENIGMGYCVTNRIANHGRQQVHEELLAAGIPTKVVDALMSSKRKVQKTAIITTENALRLLYVVAPEYEALARDAVGSAFDKLSKNRQAAVTWLAYNTGDVSSFKQLVRGVQNGNMRQAMEHMTPWFRDTTNQVMVKNERAGAYLQGAYYSEAGLKKLLDNPAAFEDRTLVHKESPIAAVDPAAAKALKKKGQLPTAPTSGPSTKPLPGATEPSPVPHWAPQPLNARKLDDWQARQAPVMTPATDQDLINRAVVGPRGP